MSRIPAHATLYNFSLERIEESSLEIERSSKAVRGDKIKAPLGYTLEFKLFEFIEGESEECNDMVPIMSDPSTEEIPSFFVEVGRRIPSNFNLGIFEGVDVP